MSNLQRKAAGPLKSTDSPDPQWLEPETKIQVEAEPEADLLVCEKKTSSIYPFRFNQEEEFSKAFYFFGFCGLLLLSFLIWF